MRRIASRQERCRRRWRRWPGRCRSARRRASRRRTERLRDRSAPPHSRRAIGAIPNAAPAPTVSQLAVRPRRHLSHTPQLTWKGTITRSPAWTVETPSATSITSATNSCPKANGPGNGARPDITAASRSQVATATGRTSASSPPDKRGAATSSQTSRPGALKVSCRMTGVLVAPAERSLATGNVRSCGPRVDMACRRVQSLRHGDRCLDAASDPAVPAP